MTRSRRLPALLSATAVLALTTALSAPGAASAAPGASAAATCPGTFQVLHNDRIGALSLPAGPYVITTAGGLGCTSAATLFASFLQDYDGNLTSPWRVIAAQSRFLRGNGPTGFSVKRSGGGSGCPLFSNPTRSNFGYYTIPAGNFRITLQRGGACSTAVSTFANYIEGLLPSGWLVDPINGTFSKGLGGAGFNAVRIPGSTGGGGTYPDNGARCPGVFNVQNNDRISTLVINKGGYGITILSRSGLSCSQAFALFRQFLNYPSGNLPSPWVVNAANGTFTRGRGSSVGFFIEPNV